VKKLYLIFLIAFQGCGYEDLPQPGPVSTAYKAVFDWQPGTYWIYRDSISGQVDSYAVADNISTEYNNNQYISDITGYINVYQGGQPYPCFFTYDINASGMSIGDADVPCGDYAPLAYTELFLAPVPNNYGNYNVNILPSFSLAGNTFYNVQQGSIQSYDSVTKNYVTTNQYFADTTVGIIKMRRYDSSLYIPNRVWELQRWKIVK